MGKQCRLDGFLTSFVIITVLTGLILFSSSVLLHSERKWNIPDSISERQGKESREILASLGDDLLTPTNISGEEKSVYMKTSGGNHVPTFNTRKISDLSVKIRIKSLADGLQLRYDNHKQHKATKSFSKIRPLMYNVEYIMKSGERTSGQVKGKLSKELLNNKNKTISTNTSITVNSHSNKALQNNDMRNSSDLPLLLNGRFDPGKSESVQLDYQKRLPQVVIVGAKKSGTKALLSFLSAHPYTKVCDKEIHFFDKHWNNGREWYRNAMPPSFGWQLTVEKSPRYFISSQAPKRMYRLLPHAKLLFIFRNPTVRALSDYAHKMSKRNVSFAKGERSSFDTDVFKRDSQFEINGSTPLIDIGRYIIHLQRWLAVFPSQQMYFVNGDRFIKEPWSEIIEVQRFLNLPVMVTRKNFVFNNNKGFYCVRNTHLNGTHGRKSCLNKNKGRQHPQMSSRTEQILNNYFRPYNRKLFTIMNRNFGWPS